MAETYPNELWIKLKDIFVQILDKSDDFEKAIVLA
jgi:hypothetical protein